MKLTPKREVVLQHLSDSLSPLTGPDFAHLALSYTGSREWAYPALRWLVDHGFVETVGASKSFTLYRATEKGRAALAE